jgi:GNAT superfamily N-acetyltransferase
MANPNFLRIRLYKKLPTKLKKEAERLIKETFRDVKAPDDEDKYCSIPSAYVLATENNSIIGVATLFRRDISYQKIKVNLGGLGSVCTMSDRRRRGVGAALVKRSMKEMGSWGCDVAYLCTTPKVTPNLKASLYGKAGFVPIRAYTYLGKSGKRYTENNGMIAPVKSRNKFLLILKGKEILDLGTGNW